MPTRWEDYANNRAGSTPAARDNAIRADYASKHEYTGGDPYFEAFDPNAFEWRGIRGAENADVERYRALGRQAQGRQGVAIDHRPQGFQRIRELEAMRAYQDQAMGRGPSVANVQMLQGLSQGAASSRIGSYGGIGAAQQAQARDAAMMQAAGGGLAAAAQGAHARGGEVMAGYGGWGGMAAGMRAGDERFAAQQAQMAAQQRALNDARQAEMERMGYSVRRSGLAARMGAEATLSNADISKQNMIQAERQFERQNRQRAMETGLAAAQGGAEATKGLGTKYGWWD